MTRTTYDAAVAGGRAFPDSYKLEGYGSGMMSAINSAGDDYVMVTPANFPDGTKVPVPDDLDNEPVAPSLACLEDIYARIRWVVEMPRERFLRLSAPMPPAAPSQEVWDACQRMQIPNLAEFVKSGDPEYQDASHGPKKDYEINLDAFASHAALAALRRAIDEAEIADHLDENLLTMVDFIIEKTEG